MRVETFAKGFVLMVVLIIVTGCASTSPEFPTGDFVDSDGNITTFMADGRAITVLSCCPDDPVIGEYSVDGDTVTFSDTGFCTIGEGVYKWALDGDNLQFEIVSDNCGGRRASLFQGWTRLDEDG